VTLLHLDELFTIVPGDLALYMESNFIFCISSGHYPL